EEPELGGQRARRRAVLAVLRTSRKTGRSGADISSVLIISATTDTNYSALCAVSVGLLFFTSAPPPLPTPPLPHTHPVFRRAFHFACADEQLGALRDACLEYFRRGGSCVEGPVGLLSGLTPSPPTLVYHFFAVAAVGMRAAFRRPGGGAAEAALLLGKAAAVIGPLLVDELRHGSSGAPAGLFADALALPTFALFSAWLALLVSLVVYT
ncbi:MAG: squalene epoxidase-domain-containing protein, partial [Olpidium bornovanus]